MTRALAAAYLICLLFAGSNSPQALTFVALGVLTGYLTLYSGLPRFTSKGRDPHVES